MTAHAYASIEDLAQQAWDCPDTFACVFSDKPLSLDACIALQRAIESAISKRSNTLTRAELALCELYDALHPAVFEYVSGL